MYENDVLRSTKPYLITYNENVFVCFSIFIPACVFNISVRSENWFYFSIHRCMFSILKRRQVNENIVYYDNSLTLLSPLARSMKLHEAHDIYSCMYHKTNIFVTIILLHAYFLKLILCIACCWISSFKIFNISEV